jgi:hypothetical protein
MYVLIKEQQRQKKLNAANRDGATEHAGSI